MSRPILTSILLIAIYWCSCSSDAPESDLKIFRYNQPTTITSLDPAFARNQSNIWGVEPIFNGLVQLDKDLKVAPCLAESWTISEDGLRYTFQLRKDVFFHDDACFPEGKGRNLKAADVAYSFNRIISPEVNSPGSWIFSGKVDQLEPFKAIDDYTFELRLKKPFRPMLGILTMQYCYVVPKEAVAKYGGEFRSHPVGTGPFLFKNWKEGQVLILLKNPNYFEKDESGNSLPKLDGIKVSFLPDRYMAFLDFKKGNLDFMSGLEATYVNDLLDKNGAMLNTWAGKVNLHKTAYLNMEYLGIQVGALPDGSILKDKRVRQAMNFGFDREKMVRELRNNVGSPAFSGFIPRGLASHDPTKVPGYKYDLQKARILLAEAGYPNGDGLPPITLLTNKDYLDLCEFITRQWEDIGIQANIEVIESAVLRERMSKEKAPFFRASWIADYPDGESFLAMFYGKNPSPPNYTRFSNEAYDALYEQVILENDDNKRFAKYQEMDRMIVEQAPVIFLIYDETPAFTTSRVKAFENNSLNIPNFKLIEME